MTISVVLMVFGAAPARAQTGSHDGQVLLDGSSVRLMAGADAGAYRARGMAEYLLTGHFGLRTTLDATINDPTVNPNAKLIERAEATLGFALHAIAESPIDPYVTAGVGALMTDNDWLGVTPTAHVAAGLNLHFREAFIGLQVGWHFSPFRGRPQGEVRAQFSVGFSFDT